MCRLEPDGARAIVRLRWGLAPRRGRDARTSSRLINACAESVHYKPSFRDAFRLRRYLLPVDSWFEWRPRGRGKQPYFLTLKNGSPLSFAALWERWGPGSSQAWRAVEPTGEVSKPRSRDRGKKSRARSPVEAFSEIDWTLSTSGFEGDAARQSL